MAGGESDERSDVTSDFDRSKAPERCFIGERERDTGCWGRNVPLQRAQQVPMGYDIASTLKNDPDTR